jgi:uncharacterized protein YndB with AHSA1/START domain
MTIVPVRREVVVAAPQEKAFDVFVRRMGSWWNPAHSIGEEDLADVVVEPHVGGRWLEVGTGGTTCPWGRVLVWEPPERVVLTWQLDTQWEYAADLETEVEVRFVVVDEGTTRVELEHRNLEAFGDGAAEMRGIFDSDSGWNGLLARYAEAT